MRLPGLLIALSLSAFFAACDRNPSVSGTVADATPEKPVKKTRPTTQELLTGSRRTIRLGIVPLTVRAPEAWEVKTYGDLDVVTFLEGPAPHDDIKIQLSRRPSTTAEKIELMVSGAKKEMAANPESIKMVDLRSAGDVKIFERQTLGHATSIPTSKPFGETQWVTETPYRWTVTFYVPMGKGFDVYELNFLNLTEQEYTSDTDFLRLIVDSLHYDASAGDLSILEAAPTRKSGR